MMQAKDEQAAHMLECLSQPLCALSKKVAEAAANTGLLEKIQKTVEDMEEDQWRDALYPMTKAPEAKALFKSLQNYDTAYKVSELSVQSYGGGVGVEVGKLHSYCHQWNILGHS